MASYVFLSSCIVISLFSKEIAIVTLLIMSISDSLAALIGKKYGKIKFQDKTLEGSITFFLSSMVIILFFPNIDLFAGIFSVIITTLIESSKIFNIDDNLTVPLSFSIFYSFFLYFSNHFLLLGLN